MHVQWLRSLQRGLSLILLVLVGAALTAMPAQAAARRTATTGDQVTLTLNNGPTFTYIGQGSTPTPIFTVTVVFPAKPSYNWAMSPSLTIAGQTFGTTWNLTESADQLTYTFSHITTTSWLIPVGTQTAVASFYDAQTQATADSNPVSFTVMQATPQVGCTIANYQLMYVPGQSLQFHIVAGSGNPVAPVDWQDATYTIQFVGRNANDTSTAANLVLDSQQDVTTQAPATFDWYDRINCSFNGTQNFAPATTQAINGGIFVSAKNPLGTIHFSTSPWPWQQGGSFQIDVKVDPTPGGPTPDGCFQLGFGNNTWSNCIELGPNGETVTNFYWPYWPYIPGLSTVYIMYRGDPYYGGGTTAFSMPSSSTPTSGTGSTPTSGTGSRGTGGAASAGAQGTASGSQTPSASGIIVAFSGGPGSLQNGTQSRNRAASGAPAQGVDYVSLALWIIAALAVVASGTIGVWLFVAQRAKRTVTR